MVAVGVSVPLILVTTIVFTTSRDDPDPTKALGTEDLATVLNEMGAGEMKANLVSYVLHEAPPSPGLHHGGLTPSNLCR